MKKTLTAFGLVGLLAACTPPHDCSTMTLQECEDLANDERKRADGNRIMGPLVGGATVGVASQTGALVWPL